MVVLLLRIAHVFIPNFMTSKRYCWAAKVAFIFVPFILLSSHTIIPSKLSVHHSDFDNDWSRFAYAQYVTGSEYLCNSVMFFHALQHLSSRADRVMMYPSHMLESKHSSSDARLLIEARDKYNVKLVPITVQHKPNAGCK
jgi:hypothetical protein